MNFFANELWNELLDPTICHLLALSKYILKSDIFLLQLIICLE